MLIEGEQLSRQPERVAAALRARRIGALMQSGNLFEHLTVMENIRLQQSLAGAKPDANDWPERLGIGNRRTALPSELSGGEAARAGLAVALAASAKILICDEPTAEVDSATEEAILDILKGWRDDGAAVLIATHSRTLAAAADRTLLIADGRLQ